jgi:hypothetical protein
MGLHAAPAPTRPREGSCHARASVPPHATRHARAPRTFVQTRKFVTFNPARHFHAFLYVFMLAATCCTCPDTAPRRFVPSPGRFVAARIVTRTRATNLRTDTKIRNMHPHILFSIVFTRPTHIEKQVLRPCSVIYECLLFNLYIY